MTKTTSSTPAKAADKLGKAQLVDQVAERTGLTKKQSEEAVSSVLETITGALQQGRSVGLPGFGTFSVKATAARTGVKPGTSEKIQIPAGKKVSYKMAADLKGKL